MQEKAKDIVAVLMREGQLSLAGLGTFTLTEQTASLNMIEGLAKPPVKRAVFNPNLQLDDSRLVRYWMLQKGLTQEQARQQADTLLHFIKRELAEHQAVQIAGLGRLFQDHSKELRFTPSEQNLSTLSFGLGAVPLAPVVRTERPISYPNGSSSASTKKAPLPVADKATQLFSVLWRAVQRYIWHIAATTALLFLLGLWYLGSRDNPSSTVVNPTPPAGAKPPGVASSNPTAVAPPPVSTETDLAYEAENEATSSIAPAQINSTIPTPPLGNYAIIAVGRYGQAANINKMVARIEAAGYQAYTKRESGLTRVGVHYNYQNESDLDEVLADVRRKFSQDAFILPRQNNR